MAIVKKVQISSNLVNTSGLYGTQRHGEGLKAGENIQRAEACYVKNADGLVWRSFATSDGKAESNEVRFYANEDVYVGTYGSFVNGPVRMGYSDGTAPKGKNVYLALPTDVVEQPFPRPYGYGYNSPENLSAPALANVTNVAAKGRLTDVPVYDGQSALGWVYPDGVKIEFFPAQMRSVSDAP